MWWSCILYTDEIANARLVAKENVRLWKENNYLRAVINDLQLQSVVSTQKIKQEPMDLETSIKEELKCDPGEFHVYVLVTTTDSQPHADSTSTLKEAKQEIQEELQDTCKAHVV